MRKSTKPALPAQTSHPGSTLDGIYLNGTCIGRTRRMVGENGSKELITYKIRTHDNLYYVKDWEANGNYITVGEIVSIPLKIQTFTSKGSTRIDYSYYRPRDMEF